MRIKGCKRCQTNRICIVWYPIIARHVVAFGYQIHHCLRDSSHETDYFRGVIVPYTESLRWKVENRYESMRCWRAQLGVAVVLKRTLMQTNVLMITAFNDWLCTGFKFAKSSFKAFQNLPNSSECQIILIDGRERNCIFRFFLFCTPNFTSSMFPLYQLLPSSRHHIRYCARLYTKASERPLAQSFYDDKIVTVCNFDTVHAYY